MRKVYLDELPHKKYCGKCCVDFEKSVGKKCLFVYNSIEEEVSIIEFDKINKELIININNYCKNFRIKVESFKKCSFGIALKEITNDFRINIGDNFIDKKRNLTVVDREYRTEIDKRGWKANRKWYKCICNKCNNEIFINEYKLLGGQMCSICCENSSRPTIGVNTIVDTDPWMIQYFQGGYNEAKMYSKGSTEKIKPICPICKKISENYVVINNIYNRKSIGCICSDGISYPNKFVYCLLEQLGVLFKKEVKFNWSKNKMYDIYIEKLNIIIENHGEQHYRNTGKWRSLENEQENDKLKEKLAKDNGVENYVVLDCSNSEVDFIKSSIINSELPKLLSFKEKDIDWSKCHEFALTNLVKEVCEYKNSNQEYTVKEISILFNLHKSTVTRYLKRGAIAGLCDYDAKKEKFKSHSKAGKGRRKMVEVFKNDISLGVFESISYLEEASTSLFGVKFSFKCISSVCLGKAKSHKGYTFKYV